MKRSKRCIAPLHAPGFSLLEILIATAILGAVLIVIASAIGTMQNTWVKVRAKADVYRTARAAVETVTRRVALATLSSRMEMKEPEDNQTDSFQEVSDLHFVSAPADQIDGLPGDTVGHAVFFQAPFGVDSTTARESSDYRHDRLSNALNAWGYYVVLSSDDQDRPSFMNAEANKVPPRLRFRLMEFRQPTSELTIFNPGSDATLRPAIDQATGKEGVWKWIKDALSNGTARKQNVSVVAENVVAFLVRPVRGIDPATEQSSDKYDLAPGFEYDSRRFQWEPGSELSRRTRHRLPASLELSFVVTTEDSWERQGPNAQGSLLQKVRSAVSGRFNDPLRFDNDLRGLRDALDEAKIDYRVIVTTVPLAEGKKGLIP